MGIVFGRLFVKMPTANHCGFPVWEIISVFTNPKPKRLYRVRRCGVLAHSRIASFAAFSALSAEMLATSSILIPPGIELNLSSIPS